MNIKIYANLHLIFVNSWNKYWPMFYMVAIKKYILLIFFPLVIILDVHTCPGLDIVPIFVSLNSSIVF